MNTALLYYDLRRSLVAFIILWSLVTSAILFSPGPLRGGMISIFLPLSLFTGAVLAIRLMVDTGGTQAFVCSRGLTRRRIFGLRIVLGAACLLTMGLMIWLMITLGLRQYIHMHLQMSDVDFYPMSTRFESSVVAPFIVTAFISFGAMSSYIVWRGLCCPEWNGTSSGVVRLMTFEVPLGALMFIVWMSTLVAPALEVGIGGHPGSLASWADFVVMLAIGISVIALFGASIASRHLEVA